MTITAKNERIAERAGVKRMKYDMLQKRMPDCTVSRQDIMNLILEVDPAFREGQMKRLLAHMINESMIEHVGRNRYRKISAKTGLKKYDSTYSETAMRVISIMNDDFSMVEFRVWELSWLNEFVNHQLGRNLIFLEVEKDGCEFIFERLVQEFEGKVLLRPDHDSILRYGANDSIIIDRLISECPKGSREKYNLAIEKLIVDMFANKKLRGMLSEGDYPAALEAIFSSYEVDQVKMFRYARRRNKEVELRSFLEQKTNVELKV